MGVATPVQTVEVGTMTLEQLVYDVEACLVDLGRRIWQPDPRAEAQEEAGRLAAELRARREALVRSEDERDAARRRLADNRRAVTRLTAQVENCVRHGQTAAAWPPALELDRARRALVEDQASLRRLEQVSWSLEFRIRQLERRLARLQEQLRPR